MRTVEQIERELMSARKAEEQAKRARENLENEMREVFLAAKNALGIEDKPIWRDLRGVAHQKENDITLHN